MAQAFLPGEVLDGKYKMIRVIGEGGWGVVFEGENVRTLRRVAIKTLRPKANLTGDVLARFEREAQAAGRIGSDHIVEVFDLGQLPDGTHYLVMELLNGESLAKRLESCQRLDPVATARMALQLLEGLAAAHSAGIVHRDLKPENLFLVPTRAGEEFVKILDFGISKFTENPLVETMTGAVLGSPYYMAPEQARGLKDIGPRADIYSIGVVLFECVTGQTPFEGDNFNDLMFQIVTFPRPDPVVLRPGLDPAFASIISKAIAADPNQRFSSALELRSAIYDWLAARGAAPEQSPELHRWSRGTPSSDGRPKTPRSGGYGSDPMALPFPITPSWAAGGTPPPTLNAMPAVATPLATSRGGAPPLDRRRKGTILALAGVLTVAVAGALAFRISGSRAVASSGEPPPAPSAAVVQTPPTAQPAQTSDARDTSAAKEAIRKSLVDLTMKATPPIARLFLDDVPLSGNPSVGQYPRDGQKHVLRVEAPRYVTQIATVPFDDSTHLVEVSLQKVPPPPPPPPATSSSAR